MNIVHTVTVSGVGDSSISIPWVKFPVVSLMSPGWFECSKEVVWVSFRLGVELKDNVYSKVELTQFRDFYTGYKFQPTLQLYKRVKLSTLLITLRYNTSLRSLWLGDSDKDPISLYNWIIAYMLFDNTKYRRI